MQEERMKSKADRESSSAATAGWDPIASQVATLIGENIAPLENAFDDDGQAALSGASRTGTKEAKIDLESTSLTKEMGSAGCSSSTIENKDVSQTKRVESKKRKRSGLLTVLNRIS